MRRDLDVNRIVCQPGFRRRVAKQATETQMAEVVRAMEATGVRVSLQAGADIPSPTAPDELLFSSEDF